MITDEVKQRFFDKVEKGLWPNHPSCWIWTASTSHGYGQFLFERKVVKAHRFSYLITYGELPEDHEIVQRCGIKSCVNPKHLEIGTRWKPHNRHNPAKGEKHYKAVLTRAQAIEALTGDAPPIFYANKFGVSRKTIYSLRVGDSWKHLDEYRG